MIDRQAMILAALREQEDAMKKLTFGHGYKVDGVDGSLGVVNGGKVVDNVGNELVI